AAASSTRPNGPLWTPSSTVMPKLLPFKQDISSMNLNFLSNNPQMTYQKTLDWMFAQLPMYQRQGKTAFKKDLTNIKAFSEVLRKPESRFKSIHVAGTNGKGSVCHILASIFQEAGYKTGLYTSPHLKDFRERIRINGKKIPSQTIIEF